MNNSLNFTDATCIHFQNVAEGVVKAWSNFLEPELRGVYTESDEVEPVGRNKVERDALYNTSEKK